MQRDILLALNEIYGSQQVLYAITSKVANKMVDLLPIDNEQNDNIFEKEIMINRQTTDQTNESNKVVVDNQKNSVIATNEDRKDAAPANNVQKSIERVTAGTSSTCTCKTEELTISDSQLEKLLTASDRYDMFYQHKQKNCKQCNPYKARDKIKQVTQIRPTKAQTKKDKFDRFNNRMHNARDSNKAYLKEMQDTLDKYKKEYNEYKKNSTGPPTADLDWIQKKVDMQYCKFIIDMYKDNVSSQLNNSTLTEESVRSLLVG